MPRAPRLAIKVLKIHERYARIPLYHTTIPCSYSPVSRASASPLIASPPVRRHTTACMTAPYRSFAGVIFSYLISLARHIPDHHRILDVHSIAHTLHPSY